MGAKVSIAGLFSLALFGQTVVTAAGLNSKDSSQNNNVAPAGEPHLPGDEEVNMDHIDPPLSALPNLDQAVLNGKANEVREIIQSNKQLMFPQNGISPIYRAFVIYRMDLVAIFLENGFKPHEKYNGRYSLIDHLAYTEIIQRTKGPSSFRRLESNKRTRELIGPIEERIEELEQIHDNVVAFAAKELEQRKQDQRETDPVPPNATLIITPVVTGLGVAYACYRHRKEEKEEHREQQKRLEEQNSLKKKSKKGKLQPLPIKIVSKAPPLPLKNRCA